MKAMKELLFQIVPILKRIGMCAAMALAMAACSDDSVKEEVNPDPDPDPTPEEVSQYVPIDWEKTEIDRFNAETGELVLSFSDEVPQLEDGLSVMVLETDTSFHIRRIMSSMSEGNTVIMETIQADMTDLFSDTEFTLSFAPEESRTNASIDNRSNVCYPVKIMQQNEDGSYTTIYDVKQNSRVEIVEKLPLVDKNLTGKIIASSEDGNMALSWESYILQLNLNAKADFKFSKPIHEKKLNEHLKIKVSELEKCTFTIGADGLAEFILRGTAKGEFSLEEAEYPLVKGLIKPLLYVFPTPVGIPVAITLSADILGDLNVNGDAQLTVTGGVTFSGGFDVGVQYTKQRDWEPIANNRFSYEPHPVTLSGEAEMNLQIAAYPKFDLKIYDFLGPTFAPKPTLRDEIKAGFLDQLGSVSDDYYGWTEKIYAGVGFQTGLKLDFIGLEDELSLPLIDPFEKQIYNSPDKITLFSPNNGTEVNVGQPVTVTFRVEADALGVSIPRPAIAVKFETTTGSVDRNFALTGLDGKVTVQWTPSQEEASLTAQIFDSEGQVIDEATFTPKTTEEETGPIVGTWEKTKVEVETIYHGKVIQTSTSSPSEHGYRDFWVLRADGTIDGYDTDAVAWPYGTYTYTGSTLNIHYLNDGGSTEIAPIIKLTESELVTQDIAVDPDDDSNMQIGTTYYVRVTDQALIDQIDRATENNPAKWWH